jgi:hypothetical protein
MRRETGSHLPLCNRVAKVAPACEATGPELDRLTDSLLERDEGDDGYVLYWLVFHPAVQDRTLSRLLNRGRCIGSLGHRPGPEHLLLRLAREHRFPEAILTLALFHYGTRAHRREEFLSLVREFVDVKWLRTSLRVSDAAGRIPGEARRAALKLVDDYEREPA